MLLKKLTTIGACGLRTYIFTVFFFEIEIKALKRILHVKQMKFRFQDSTNTELFEGNVVLLCGIKI